MRKKMERMRGKKERNLEEERERINIISSW